MGGSSKSKSHTDQSTNITTTTSTKIGDIGLTGKDATKLAEVISNANSELAVLASQGVVQGVKSTVEAFAPVLYKSVDAFQTFAGTYGAQTVPEGYEPAPSDNKDSESGFNAAMIIGIAGAAMALYSLAKR